MQKTGKQCTFAAKKFVTAPLAFNVGFEGVPLIWVKPFLVSEVLRYTGRLRKSNIRTLAFKKPFLGPLHFLHPLSGGCGTRLSISSWDEDLVYPESDEFHFSTFFHPSLWSCLIPLKLVIYSPTDIFVWVATPQNMFPLPWNRNMEMCGEFLKIMQRSWLLRCKLIRSGPFQLFITIISIIHSRPFELFRQDRIKYLSSSLPPPSPY